MNFQSIHWIVYLGGGFILITRNGEGEQKGHGIHYGDSWINDHSLSTFIRN